MQKSQKLKQTNQGKQKVHTSSIIWPISTTTTTTDFVEMDLELLEQVQGGIKRREKIWDD